MRGWLLFLCTGPGWRKGGGRSGGQMGGGDTEGGDIFVLVGMQCNIFCKAYILSIIREKS